MRPKSLGWVLALVACLPGLLLLAAAPPVGNPSEPAAEDPAVAAYLVAAEEVYAWHCSVCHGATGDGVAEAKSAFPEDHRDCTRCHKPSNRVVQPLDQPFQDNDMFSIGEPPALHARFSGAALAADAEPAALYAYIAATMPRYDPGRLSEDDYWALTALLLDMNGRKQSAATVARQHLGLGP